MGALLEALIAAGERAEALRLWRNGATFGLRVPRRTLLRLLRVSAEQLPRGGEEADPLLELYAARLYGEGVGPELELIRAYAARGHLATALEVYRLCTATEIGGDQLCTGGAEAAGRPDGEDGGAPPPRPRQHGATEAAQLLEAAVRACVEAGEMETALRLYRHAAAAAPSPAGYHPSSPEHHGALLYLLGACAAGGALREGFALLVEATLDGAETKTWPGLGRASARAGAWAPAGVAALLQGCADHEEPELAWQAYQWASGEGLLPCEAQQAEALDLALAALVPLPTATEAPRREAHASAAYPPPSAEHLQCACTAYQDGVARGLPFDSHAAGAAVVLALARAGHVAEAARVLSDAAGRGEHLSPPLAAERALWRECYEQGVQDDAATWPVYQHLFERFAVHRRLHTDRGDRGRTL
eukprot:Transcript_11394.p2 GENE.Transcript_11394~~Transcript_11394.p2  ORF type:complete len:417 (+),score=105.64 Transcript_11394:361-1611(+)